MVIKKKKDKYSCPCCGRLPEPKIFSFQKEINVETRFAYKFENGLLKIPLEKKTLFKCCEGDHLIPFHSSELEYLETVKDILSFHIGEDWVDRYIYNNQIYKK